MGSMTLCAGLLLLSALTVEASYNGNLNYRSPSLNHPELGISIHRVVKRQDDSMSTIEASALNFTHGVASGDPMPNSVILWTRAAPMQDNDHSNVTVSGTVPMYNHDTAEYVAVSKAPVCVEYKVAKDKGFKQVVNTGRAFTSSDIDWTLKVEATNLAPFTKYFYQFNICNSKITSPVGRTQTIPNPTDKVSRNVKLAVYSCSNYPNGFFNAYGNPVRKDSVDWVLHLGDYTYETASNPNPLGRVPLPDKEIFSLYDYRKRIATYRTDLDLFANHQNFAWIPVWDDHEVADNTWRGSSSHLNNTESSFLADGGVSVDQRKMNAVRAYFEWMPLRQVEMDDNLRIWRNFQIGTLFDLIMLDTRQYDRSITDLYWNTHYIHEIANDAGRTMMGSRQENWFYGSLIESQKRNAAWRVIGNQVVFSRINQSQSFGPIDPLNGDQWDGYQANRNRTLQTLYNNKIDNTIFLAGDSHANWVSDLVWLDEKSYDPVTGAGSIGVEFASTAVSSSSPFGANTNIANGQKRSQFLIETNEELQWQEGYYRGYIELELGYDKSNVTYFGMPTLKTRNPLEIALAQFEIKTGANKLTRNPTVGGGVAEAGALKGGKIKQTNRTIDTSTGKVVPPLID